MKTIVAVIIALMAPTAIAAQETVLSSKIQVDEYIASISGPAGCKMPADLRNPQKGDCEVKKGYLETGWRLVQLGDRCYRDEIKLDKWRRFEARGGLAIDLPQTTLRHAAVKCPA